MSTDPYLFLPYWQGHDSFLIQKSLLNEGELASDGLPLPPEELLLGHNHVNYIEWGQEHVATMRRILGESGHRFEEGQRVLDFGCGSGRMIRGFIEEAKDSEFWGVDIRSDHIFWAKHHLSPPFHFATTTVVPHLPFEDCYFDLIYAGSVFTHVDDLADAWFLEMRRILRPGGMMFFTIHDQHSAELTRTTLRDDFVGKILYSHENFESFVNSDFAMFTVWRSADSQVFYDLDYLRGKLWDVFDILSVHEEAYGYQTAVLVQKPDTERPERSMWRQAEPDEQAADLATEHQKVLNSRTYRFGHALAAPYWRLLEFMRKLKGTKTEPE